MRKTDNIIVHQRMMGHLFIGLRSNKKVILFPFNEATDWWSVLISMGGGVVGKEEKERKGERARQREGVGEERMNKRNILVNIIDVLVLLCLNVLFAMII